MHPQYTGDKMISQGQEYDRHVGGSARSITPPPQPIPSLTETLHELDSVTIRFEQTLARLESLNQYQCGSSVMGKVPPPAADVQTKETPLVTWYANRIIRLNQLRAQIEGELSLLCDRIGFKE